MEWSHIIGRGGLYSREGEVCDGSQGMSAEEAASIIALWVVDDRHDPHARSEYTYVPGRELTVSETDAWLIAEERAGKNLTFDEMFGAQA